MSSRLLAVEGVRGAACFMVVLAHLILFFFPHLYLGAPEGSDREIQKLIRDSPFAFFYSGLAAVYIFFVLSGYILTAVALNKGYSRNRVLSMVIKRYPRLGIPATFSCIIAFAILFSIDLKVISHPLLVGPFSKGSLWGSEAIFGNFDYSLHGAIFSGAIDVFFLSGRSLYNPVLWTMEIELIGSFIVYILCVAFAKKTGQAEQPKKADVRSILLQSLPLFILIVVASLVAIRAVDHRFGIGLICFIAGFLFRIYGVNISTAKSMTLLIAGLYLAGAHNDSGSYGLIARFVGKYTYELCNALSGLLIVYAVIHGEKLYDAFSNRVSVFMGKVSFSVYIIHFPIIATLGVYLFGVFFDNFGSYEISAILASIFTVLFIYAASVLVYIYIDLKGMNFSNFLSRKIIQRIGLSSKLRSAAEQ